MHELAITQSVVESITDRLGDARVRRVSLSIGRLSGVVPDSVRFSFEVLTAGTGLDGAFLDIQEPMGWARCRSCGVETATTDAIVVCPCGSLDVAIVGGQDLRILSVEVAERV